MNAQERRRRKRRKQMYRRVRILLPIVVIILLIAGLTAGGIILSLNQTKKGNSGEPKETQSGEDIAGNDEQQTPEEVQSGEDVQPEETTGVPVPDDEEIFEEMLAGIRSGLQEDAAYLTAAGDSFEDTLQVFSGMDTSGFTQENKELYDIILDYMQIESLGAAYVGNAPASGQRMVDVAGGTDYYVWLVKKLSGGRREMQEIHDMLANEINTNYGTTNALMQADVMLAENSKNYTRNAPANEYLFSTVTSSSDTLLTGLACDALANGWTEFGIIRAYQMDSSLSGNDNMKNYLICSTRMAYAMYGLVDFYVHYSAWNLDQVTTLCNQYFGGGQEAFAQSLYQMVLDNPGRFAAAGVGYLELVNIEAALREKMADYSEQSLFDFLFGKGPASFRVYWNWIEQITA